MEQERKENMEEIIYFSVNNWFCGRDYPPTENFKKWLGDDLNQTFSDDKWAKENKLCIYFGVIDMSHNYTVAAPRSWVEKNCPELLTDDEYTYVTCTYGKDGEKRQEHKAKYSDFVDHPDESGEVTARFDWPYPEYKEENFGCHWYVEPYDDISGYSSISSSDFCVTVFIAASSEFVKLVKNPASLSYSLYPLDT